MQRTSNAFLIFLPSENCNRLFPGFSLKEILEIMQVGEFLQARKGSYSHLLAASKFKVVLLVLKEENKLKPKKLRAFYNEVYIEECVSKA